MPFTIFYNLSDLTRIDAELRRLDLPRADLLVALAVLAGGWKSDATAPKVPPEQSEREEGDTDTRAVTIIGVTLRDFRDWLVRRSKEPGGEYLARLADDMGRSSGAVEV